MRNCSQYGEMIARPLQLSTSGRMNVPTNEEPPSMMHLDLDRPATGRTVSAIQQVREAIESDPRLMSTRDLEHHSAPYS